MVDSVLFAFVQLLPYLAVVAFLLIGVKTYLFVTQKTSSWRPFNYFYFAHSHIERSHSQHGQRKKRFQNRLSVIISIMLLLILTGYVFMKKFAAT